MILTRAVKPDREAEMLAWPKVKESKVRAEVRKVRQVKVRERNVPARPATFRSQGTLDEKT
jgi:hypothetical protein